MARRAWPKIEPRKSGYVVTYRGKVICRAPDHKSCESFMDGWREAAAEREKRSAQA